MRKQLLRAFQAQREEIMRQHAEGVSLRVLAVRFGTDPRWIMRAEKGTLPDHLLPLSAAAEIRRRWEAGECMATVARDLGFSGYGPATRLGKALREIGVEFPLVRGRILKRTSKACERCGMAFGFVPSRRRRFCSRVCAARSREERRRSAPEISR